MNNFIQSLYTLESHIFESGSAGRSLVSAIRSIAGLRLIKLTIDQDGDYVNAQSDGVIVSPVPHRTDLRKMRARVADYWFAGYVPGPGDVVVDVGAGIGEDTVVFAGYVGSQGRVFSFEANPGTARCLTKTVQRSGLMQVKVIAAAVSDMPGTIAIADAEAHVRNSIFINEGEQSINVDAITLDDFVESNDISRIDLLKMNIEGAERLALSGFRRRFSCVRNVAIACHDWIADLGHSDSYRTLDFVREFLRDEGFILQQRKDDNSPWIRDTLIGSRSSLQ
ncbi:MAG: FkbM family methyltransferase [Nitrospirae bacterium]|nr:FkbM family methyltransferase [Nitrospirota bacterium]